MMARRTPVVGAFAACLVTAALAACNATTLEDVVPPVTGVRVDTLDLFGADSCGPADWQIAKTAVTVTALGQPDDAGNRSSSLVKIGRFDCFTDPGFVEPSAIRIEYELRVFGFSAAHYDQHAAVLNDHLKTSFAGKNDMSAAAAVATAAEDDAALAAVADVIATCTVNEYENVYSTAACTIDFDARPGRGGSSDAGDAGDAGAHDAGDASDDDAGLGDAGDADASDGDGGDASDDGGS
jgi:hypothetical protein